MSSQDSNVKPTTARAEAALADGALLQALWRGLSDDPMNRRDLWRILGMLRRRRLLILAVFLPVLLVTGLKTYTAQPTYTAQTLLLIERPQLIDVEGALEGTPSSASYFHNPQYYQTQYQILGARSLALQVIQELGLEDHPAFQSQDAAARSPLSIDSAIVDRYQGRVRVDPVRDTRLVRIAFSSSDPELAARVANAHARAYILRGMALRAEASEGAREFLETTLVQLTHEIEHSEAELSAYRRDKGIISLETKENLVLERLAELSRRLTQSQATRITLEADMRMITERDYASLPAVMQSSVIQRLRQELATMEANRAFELAHFKPGATELAQLNAQIEGARLELRKETQRVIAAIESEYLAAVATEKRLAREVEGQKAAALQLKDAAVEYAILEREVETKRGVHDTVLQRLQEVTMEASLRASNVFVVDEAYPPRRPSAPRKGLNLLVGVFFGLAGGIGAAFVREHLDNRLSSPQDVEDYLELPSLALVPELGSSRTWLGRRTYPPELLSGTAPENGKNIDQGTALALDAYRGLRTEILLSKGGESARSLLFTSSKRGEGKTATILNTAVAFASRPARVLVVDADLRRPRCHKVLGVPNIPGLAEVLSGQVPLELAIQSSKKAQVSFLPSGGPIPDPSASLAAMEQLIPSLKERYDYILIDAPPITPIPDAIVLSRLVDGVVLVVDQQHTARHLVAEAGAKLAKAQANVLGVVLNRVDLSEAHYSHYFDEYRA